MKFVLDVKVADEAAFRQSAEYDEVEGATNTPLDELVRRIAEAVLVSNMEFDGYPCSITVEKVSDSAGPRSDV